MVTHWRPSFLLHPARFRTWLCFSSLPNYSHVVWKTSARASLQPCQLFWQCYRCCVYLHYQWVCILTSSLALCFLDGFIHVISITNHIYASNTVSSLQHNIQEVDGIFSKCVWVCSCWPWWLDECHGIDTNTIHTCLCHCFDRNRVRRSFF